MRLIDADEFEKRIKPYDTEDDMDKALYNFAHYHLITTPSAQPEIIRCKDCKHYEIWQLKSDYTDDKRYKPSVCVVGCYAVHRSEDWFCADAERSTE